MGEQIGIIFVDHDEVILRIYIPDKNLWKLLRYQCYDLASGIPGTTATSTDIIEIIAGIFLTHYAATTLDWKICGRDVHESIIHDISAATGLRTELLTLQREQELLCKGMLMEME